MSSLVRGENFGSSNETDTNSNTFAKRAINSCQACRKAKAKCDRNNPCARCVTKSIACEYTDEVDGRRRRSDLKRKVEELEYERSVLCDTLDAIRTADTTAGIAEIIQLIKNHASLPELQNHIEKQVKEREPSGLGISPGLEEIRSQVSKTLDKTSEGSNTTSTVNVKRPRKRADELHIARLVDDPPIKVAAQPWTEVTDDDHLVSHLISLWFTWGCSPGYIIHEDLFVRDMRAGKIASNYCSPFLVNCVLAGGCLFSQYQEAKTRLGSPSELCSDFFAEARRHLDRHDGQKSVSVLQGLCVLLWVSAMINQDRLGRDYYVHATEVYQALLDNHDRDTYAHLSNENAEDYEMVRGLSTWGAFNMLTAAQLVWKRPSYMRVPSEAWRRNHARRDIVKKEWTNYPSSTTTLVAHRDDIFVRFADLTLLEQEMTRLLFDIRSTHEVTTITHRDPIADLMRVFAALSQWHSSTPQHLQPRQDSSPDIFLLHIWYHEILLILVGGLHIMLKHGLTSHTNTDTTHDTDLEAVHAISSLIRSFQEYWGADKLPAMTVAPIVHSIYRLSSEMPAPKYEAVLIELCDCLRVMGRRFPVAVSLLRVFQLDMLKQGKKVPDGLLKLFKAFERSDMQDFNPYEVDSLIPVPIMAGRHSDGRRTEVETITMTNFLRLAEDLRISE